MVWVCRCGEWARWKQIWHGVWSKDESIQRLETTGEGLQEEAIEHSGQDDVWVWSNYFKQPVRHPHSSYQMLSARRCEIEMALCRTTVSAMGDGICSLSGLCLQCWWLHERSLQQGMHSHECCAGKLAWLLWPMWWPCTWWCFGWLSGGAMAHHTTLEALNCNCCALVR